MATPCRSLLTASLIGLVLGSAPGCASPEPAEVLEQSPQPLRQPPAISGGTLLLLKDNKTAVAADPDRDVIWLADLDKLAQSGRIDLLSGDEPGRLVQDAAGKVHVALRRGGALLTIDPVAGKIVDRRPACPAPRGLAYDPATDRLHVACAGGEVVTFAAAGGAALRTWQLDSDLRDILVSGSNLILSRFRSAELLTVDADGTVIRRIKPRAVFADSGMGLGDPLAEAAVAWRIRARADGNIAMLFERKNTTQAVDTKVPGVYGSGACSHVGIVGSALTIFSPDGFEYFFPVLHDLAYSVDFVVESRDLGYILVVPSSQATPQGSVMEFGSDPYVGRDQCGFFPGAQPLPAEVGASNDPVAVEYDGSRGRWVVQTRNPLHLVVGNVHSDSQIINFQAAADVGNAGHALFHQSTPALVACASCHPEGGDDGRVWDFAPGGKRRTQDLRGGILATAPFHWDGSLPDMQHLMDAVFVGRMGGTAPSSAQVDAIASWLDGQPALPKAAPSNPQAVARGQQLFASAAVGCAGCHSGPHFTNNTTVSVGTGPAAQVPSLRDVATRAPYLRSGCAGSLAARFDPACGGGDNHGKTSQLPPEQLADLVSYLQTL